MRVFNIILVLSSLVFTNLSVAQKCQSNNASKQKCESSFSFTDRYKANNQKMHEETINKEFTFKGSPASSTLYINNLHGKIMLEGYSGNTVKVEVEKVIYAKNQEKISEGIKEVSIGNYQTGDALYLYTDAPGVRFKSSTGNYSYTSDGNWNGGACKDGYDFALHFHVKVPKNANVHIASVSGCAVTASHLDNKSTKGMNVSGHVSFYDVETSYLKGHSVSGHVSAKEVDATELDIQSVSGHLDMIGVSGQTDAQTVSGCITALYSENPKDDSRYETLSGNINVSFKENLNATINYDLKLSGNFTTDFDASNKSYTRGDNNRSIKVGNGQIDLNFETLSGSINVKRD